MDPDGRLSGYDTVSQQHLLQVSGAREGISSSADDDDDNTDGRVAPLAPGTTPVSDRRELEVPGRLGGGWTLVVADADAGRFTLRLQLFAHDHEGGSVHDSETTLPLAKGQIRRFALHVGVHTFELTPLP